jgi:hypothetical protein
MHQALKTLKQTLKVAGIAATSSALVTLGASSVWAGQATVVITGDSSAGGTVNFNANADSAAGVSIQTISTSGTEVPVTVAPNVDVTVSSQATAVALGTITQAQADTGVGSGGAVVSAAPEVVTAVVDAANVSSGAGAVGGAGLQGLTSPAAAISTLADVPAVADVTVITPSGASVSVGQALNNLAAALAGGDGVVLPTALNDAAIVILTALRNDPGNAELRTAGRAVGALLRAVRSAGSSRVTLPGVL